MASATFQIRALFVAACVLLLVSCRGSSPQATVLAGETMGSAWTVKLAGKPPMDEARLRAGIQEQFDAVDTALNSSRPHSALNRFNAAPDGNWQQLDPELFEVLRYALEVAHISRGTFDPTVAPLADLWAPGPAAPGHNRSPSAEQLARARALVGWRRIELDVSGRRARRPPGVRVDLSSLGKGRGVDRVAVWLHAAGMNDFMINLSGKLLASGRNPQGKPWRVAVEKPATDDPAGRSIVTSEILPLAEQAIVTAGDFRQHPPGSSRQHSHLIDPFSGMPVRHGTAAATAVAHECMVADGWATLLVLVPRDVAVALADRYGVAALLIVREGDETRVLHTERWKKHIAGPAPATRH